jgi:hypothetical protein
LVGGEVRRADLSSNIYRTPEYLDFPNPPVDRCGKRDGQRFLIKETQTQRNSAGPEITVVVNWAAELKQ